MNVKIDLPPDVEEILRSQADKAGVDPETYMLNVLGAFLRAVENNPRLRVAGAKLGWDWLLPFAQWVRESADEIALDWQLSQASEPTATPHQRAEAFRAWARLPRPKSPILSDEAVSRESIYEESL